MKAILLYAKSVNEIVPVGAADFNDLGTGKAIAAPGAVGYVLTNTGRLTPANIQLIQFRS